METAVAAVVTRAKPKSVVMVVGAGKERGVVRKQKIAVDWVSTRKR